MATEAPLSPQDETSTRRLTLVDGLIILGFSLFAFAYHVGRWQGVTPFVFLGGDAANIASFAAALDHPDLFQGDEFLGDPQNFRIYSALHVPLVQALARVAGDYGTAFIFLLGPLIFIQALGFYILGRVLFQNRYWATLLAIITLMPVTLNLGEYWGIYEDPQPRFFFQALLPYVLAAAFYWRTKPTVWPWLLGGAGALIYIHPVSAPAWGLAIWLGMWIFHPTSWPFIKRLGYMLFLGAIFLTVSSPFLLHYLQSHASSTTQRTEYSQVYQIMEVLLTDDFLDVLSALKGFILRWGHQWFYWIWAAMGIALVMWIRREDRKSVYLIGLWLAGILITSVAIPWVEQSIARANGLLPVEIDLVRGIRYTVPIMLLFCLWPLAEIVRQWQQVQAKKFSINGFYIAGVLLVAMWIYWHPPDKFIQAIACWGRGQLVCVQGGWHEAIEALNAVRRETPSDAKILPTQNSLQIRYYALRPVVYSYKDGGLLSYTNHSELLKWYENYKEMEAINKSEDPEVKLNRLLALSRKLNAQYLLVDFSFNPALTYLLGVDPIWSNKMFALLKVERGTSSDIPIAVEKVETNPASPLYDPQRLIDGQLSTGWFSNPAFSPTEPQELHFDFGQTKTVNRLVLVPWSDSYAFPKEWSLQASLDGRQWQPIDVTPTTPQTSVMGTVPVFTFPTIQARYFKLIVSRMPPAGPLSVFHPAARWPNPNEKVQIGSGVELRAGCPDHSFGFRGIDSYVQIEDSLELKPETATISVWFRVKELDGQLHSLVRQDQSEHYGYWLAWDNRGGRNHIWWEIGDGHDGRGGRPGHFHTLLAPIDLRAGEWMQVVATYDGRELRVYRGGELIGSGVYGDAIEYRPAPVLLGSASPAGTYALVGEMADVMLYDWSLDLNEVGELVALPRGACWPLLSPGVEKADLYRFGFKEVRFSLAQEKK